MLGHLDRTLICDEQTDGQTWGHSMYRASIALRGKNGHRIWSDTNDITDILCTHWKWLLHDTSAERYRRCVYACLWLGDHQYVKDDGLWSKLEPGPCAWWAWRRRQQIWETKSQEIQKSRSVFSKFTRLGARWVKPAEQGGSSLPSKVGRACRAFSVNVQHIYWFRCKKLKK